MKVLLQSVLALIILAFPIYVQSCPNCVEPEIFPYNLLELSDGICIEVETYCRDAYGNEYQCPPAFPSECFYENDALQLCFRVTNWCGVGDFSAEQVGLEIAGQQVNFWTEHITPSWPGQTFDFCLDPDQIVNFYTPGLAFAEGQLPTVNFIIDDYSYATMQVVIPDGAVVVGDLASDGNYQWSESFPVASNLGFKSCLGDPQQSITGSAGISFSENSGWSIGGVINMGGQEQSITGSFSASYSFGASSGNSYETSITGFLPVVEEEDCEGFAGSNCDKCCFHLNAAVEQEIQQYQLVEYSCEGGALVQEELVPVIAGYGAVQFSLGSYISCPSSPLYINPRKLYDDGNRFVPIPPFGIAIEEFIDFDLYTLTWSGPNGFTAVNQTLLENLEPGEYCYTLTHCSCENPVDKGCLVLCPEATPVSGWRYHEEKGLYCREFTCGQVPGIMNECVDGAACSEWEYAEENNACFREACHEGELLFVESNAPYEISYEYQNHFCQAIIACREGEELIIETPAEYSEPFFDETEGTCFRYVICGGQSIRTQVMEW